MSRTSLWPWVFPVKDGNAIGLVFGVAALSLMACGASSSERDHAAEGASEERPDSCPAQAKAPRPLPGVRAEHRTLAYWLKQQKQYGTLDEVLLSPQDIDDHNAALAQPERAPRGPARVRGQIDFRDEIRPDDIRAQVTRRLSFINQHARSGAYVDEDGDKLDRDAIVALSARKPFPSLRPEIKRAQKPIRLRCGPRLEGLYKQPIDLAFDRNNCSTIRAQEPLQVLSRWTDDLLLVRTPYALGWIDADSELSDPLSTEEIERSVPRADRPLTRRALLKEAFRLLDEPYGWGGHEGGRDCSRYLLDVLSKFAIRAPRHSSRQAEAGSFTVNVSEAKSDLEKAALIEAAARRGIVLLHFPGHIMLYLGRTLEGTPMAIHSFSEYVTPCQSRASQPQASKKQASTVDQNDSEHSDSPTAFETLHRVDRVAVSDLTLGEGSSRGSFLARITKLAVFGGPVGDELRGVSRVRPPAPWSAEVVSSVPNKRRRTKLACDDSTDAAIFHSPRRPVKGQPVRVIALSEQDPQASVLTLIAPDGTLRQLPETHLGPLPFGRVTRFRPKKHGIWTAVWGEGSRVIACERFAVRRAYKAEGTRAEAGPAWVPTWAWERDTENLYATFVEQLFLAPEEGDETWPDLQTLLRDPQRNLLHNHLGLNEDRELRLKPDCADLPYFLRAYVAWKLRLPFAYRNCGRGGPGDPPSCGAPHTNLDPYDASDDVAAFRAFIRDVKSAVHSASGRTHPSDEQTDLYPVALTRAALRPGTVFADPYGHLLILARWRPQGIAAGVLMGADAQPDGTVGRRRFWRGSFLFTPETANVGAGFKAWRPAVYDRKQQTISVADNAELRRSAALSPWSRQQYRGSADDFYESMEGLINLRPLDPEARQRSLVDALEENVARRVVSVDNGEAFMRARNYQPIEMPEGAGIFQTSGPWEDYSTPSRDMRLLISMDAVTRFADYVARHPQRFDVPPKERSRVKKRLESELSRALLARTFAYTRSDGSQQTLSLKELVGRQQAMEMAYHPGDCVELRWGARPGTKEHATCQRHAPKAHRARMARYRDWFRKRARPIR